MEYAGVINYQKLKYLYYFLITVIAVYFLNTILIFYINLKVVDYSPPFLGEIKTHRRGQDESRLIDYYKMICKRNLFSIVIDEDEKAGAEDLMAHIDRLSLTSLNCTLIGTIINEGGESWAIIKDNQSNRQGKYIVGSTISGAKVVMILRNKVVLNFNGKDELLVMGIEKIRADKKGDEKETAGKGKGEVITYKISRNFVKESINNIARIMSTVRIRPFLNKQGKPAGFKVSSIKKGSILKTMGFKEGDIITGMNGQGVHTAEDIMKLYNTLKDSNFFSISILRNNQSKTLNFKVR